MRTGAVEPDVAGARLDEQAAARVDRDLVAAVIGVNVVICACASVALVSPVTLYPSLSGSSRAAHERSDQ